MELNHFAYIERPRPIVLLTCAGRNGGKNVMTLTWSMPTSFKPPLIAVSVGKSRYSHKLINETQEFVINIPPKSLRKQIDFCGNVSGRDVDKYKASGLTSRSSRKVGAPIIAECMAHHECRVVDQLDAGDHTLFVGRVVASYGDPKLRKNAVHDFRIRENVKTADSAPEVGSREVDRYRMKYYEEEGNDGRYQNPYIGDNSPWHPPALKFIGKYFRADSLVLDIGVDGGGDKAFDNVLFASVIGLLPDSEKALTEINRVNKNRIIITAKCPTRKKRRRPWQEAFSKLWDGHISEMFKKELFTLLEKCNLRIVKWERFIISRRTQGILSKIDRLIGNTPLKHLPIGKRGVHVLSRFWELCRLEASSHL